MRQRRSPQARRTDILNHARNLFHRQGYAATEMEDIRKACGLSRGGLYHHFAGKAAILDAIASEEIEELARRLAASGRSPVEVLLEAGSSHLGNDPGIMAALNSAEEKLACLSGFDTAATRRLSPLLSASLVDAVRPGVNAGHVAELFLTVSAHINRRVCLGDWTENQGAGFAATALEAMLPFLREPIRLRQIIEKLREQGSQ